MRIGNHSKWDEGLVLNEFLIQEKKNFVGDLHNLVLIHCKNLSISFAKFSVLVTCYKCHLHIRQYEVECQKWL